jgi:peptidase E
MPDPLIQAALAEAGKPGPTVAYIGTASGDDESFFSRLASMLEQCGAGKITHALISTANADLDSARAIISSADIVCISGGDVERGMQVLEQKNMVGFLRDLYLRGVPFFGLSAGSIMLASRWVRWSDPDDDSTAGLFPCLGFAPVVCDTHDEEGGWEELKAALALMPDGTRGYGIASGTALKVWPDGRLLALGGAVFQFVNRLGKVVRVEELAL